MAELTPDCDQSLIEQYFDQELRKAGPILLRWEGGVFSFWEFEADLDRLTLRIMRRGTPGHLTITCDGPLEMSGPFSWIDSEVRVTRDRESFLVTDARAGFRLRACVVEVEEDGGLPDATPRG